MEFDEYFDAVSAEKWREKLRKDLKGKSFDELMSYGPAGVAVKPFYTKGDLPPGWEGQNTFYHREWKTVEALEVTDEKSANKEALDLLNRGCDALLFYIYPHTDPGKLLEDIEIPAVTLHFVVETDPLPFWLKFRRFVQKNFEGKELSGSVNFDLIENLARTGKWFESEGGDLDRWKELQENPLPGMRTVCSNINLFHNAGATPAQELGIALAFGHEYLTHTDKPDPEKFWFNFATGRQYFFEIAKLRAFRQLWSFLLGQYELEGEAHIYTETGMRNKTKLDIYNNILRTTTEAMAAVAGGCDELAVLPFDNTVRQASRFSRRIARNQSLILAEESYFSHLTDTAKGAYFIENLTSELGEKGWGFFKDIEARGGILQALKDGWLQAEIKKAADEEQEALDRGEIVLVGTTRFRDEEEDLSHLKAGKPASRPKDTEAEPVVPRRLAEKTEQQLAKDQEG